MKSLCIACSFLLYAGAALGASCEELNAFTHEGLTITSTESVSLLP